MDATIPGVNTGPAGLRTRAGALLLAGLGALLVLRLATLFLSPTGLFFDEAQYWAWSRDLAWGYFSKPPLIAWAIRGLTEVCGNGEACVRAAAPLAHTVTAVLLVLAGRATGSLATGLWAGLVYATLPGTAVSSALISTDAVLMPFWVLALLAWMRLVETRALGWSVVAGLALGGGLLAKYAMAYFVLCAGIHMAVSARPRWLLRDVRALIPIVIAAVMIAPNIAWNLDHGLVTFTHTAANAHWTQHLVHPLKMLEFVGAQFGVFGPVLFAVLGFVVLRRDMWRGDEPTRLLLAFCVPVIALITLQAFLSRAHANWAAVAYPAATILVVRYLLSVRPRLLTISTVLHVAITVLVAAAFVFGPKLTLPGGKNPFDRLTGWDTAADEVRATLRDGQYGAILTDDRMVTTEMLYYLRDVPVPLFAWKANATPHDHFELTRPYTPGAPGPLLYVTAFDNTGFVTRHFGSVTPLPAQADAGASGRDLSLFRLAEPKDGPAAKEQSK